MSERRSEAPRWRKRGVWAALVLALALAAPGVGAQEGAPKGGAAKLAGPGAGDQPAPAAPEGMACTVDQLKTWQLAHDARAWADARSAAEALLERDSDDAVAHIILGFVHHYGEGNLPRSIWYFERGLKLLRSEHGTPVGPGVGGWEAFALRELGRSQSQLGRPDDAIASYEEHDRLYPDEIPEKISTVWPLMQLRRFDDALYVAHSVLRDPTTNPGDRAVALNGYVAVLFERGDREEAYKWALQLTQEYPESPTFWCNAAEAARALMDLPEAERLALQSTQRGIADYAQPWLDLAELYMREGRLVDAYQALLADRRYREGRPPYLEQQGAAVASRTVAMLMLLYNDPEAARKLTRRAVVQPDRGGGKSRDDRQDLATSALLDYLANTDRAMMLEDQADILGGLRLFTRGPGWSYRSEAWTARHRAQSFLHDNEVLIGMVRVGGPNGVALPPWLVGELAHIVGPGTFYNAVRRAQDEETSEALDPYFDAFRADAEWALGDRGDAADYARDALKSLPESESLLRLRMTAMIADELMDDGRWEEATSLLEPVVAGDPGVLRRLGVPLPLVEPSGGPAASVYADLLATDRYVEAPRGWTPVSGNGESVCLRGPSGAQSKCSTTARGEMSAEDFGYARSIEFHHAVFRPDAPVEVAALRALDGHKAPSTGNKGLRNLLSPKEEEKEAP